MDAGDRVAFGTTKPLAENQTVTAWDLVPFRGTYDFSKILDSRRVMCCAVFHALDWRLARSNPVSTSPAKGEGILPETGKRA